MQSDVEKGDREKKASQLDTVKQTKKRDNYKETSHANNEIEKQK
jgi:hypothetical protein